MGGAFIIFFAHLGDGASGLPWCAVGMPRSPEEIQVAVERPSWCGTEEEQSPPRLGRKGARDVRRTCVRNANDGGGKWIVCASNGEVLELELWMRMVNLLVNAPGGAGGGSYASNWELHAPVRRVKSGSTVDRRLHWRKSWRITCEGHGFSLRRFQVA